MTYEQIRYDVAERVATITLARPERRNAWTRRMGHEFRTALAAAAADCGVRAIVVTGAGTDFCVGADLEGGGAVFAEQAAAEAAGETRRPLRAWEVPKPIIGALNGTAAGVGATLPLQWDVRLAGERTRLGFVFVRRGLVPEAGSTWILPRLVGMSRAAELLLTGRMLGAEEALAWGLVSRVVPDAQLVETARTLAREVAAGTAPVATALTKRLLWHHAGSDDPAAAEALEARVFAWAKARAEAREGLRAFADKRAPIWPEDAGVEVPDLDAFVREEE
ncbi:MAG TPA: enoyl-CoA hydratase-related protein [Candidatus Limnocylindria bacterium]|nr:enoyl-CoA hydratase-related protein [Candidatus Limnocylindria bacterium]